MNETALKETVLKETIRALTTGKGVRYDAAEVYAKRGRSRRITLGAGVSATTYSEEQGWAVRASTRRASLFATGTGVVSPEGPWPEADGRPLELPQPQVAAAWQEPSDFEAPLAGEREGLAFLRAMATALEKELPGARLLHGSLEDGASEVQILNSHGVEARHRNRLAALYVEAAGPGPKGSSANLYLAERQASNLNPLAVARRLADRLMILQQGTPQSCDGSRDRGSRFLLAPPVMARLLDLLRPLLLGPRGVELAAELAGGKTLGSEALSILDDGRLNGGALEAPVDGEGVPTREAILVDRGTFRHPLLDWRQSPGSPQRVSGCSRRASWRDVPVASPTHLYLRPRGGVSVGDLLGEIHRGYYLLEVTGAAELDWATGRFSLPVCGLEIGSSRAKGPVSGSRLCGSVGALLRGVEAVARDLCFFPLAGMLGSPTTLVSGLELEGR